MRIISKILFLSVAGAFAVIPATAKERQNPSATDSRKSFQEFRKGLLSDYNDFRERVLDQYADFLNGEWHEYESLRGEVRDKTPKPRTAPTVKPQESKDKPKDTKVKPQDTKVNPSAPVPGTASEEKPIPVKNDNTGSSDEFSFYGLPVCMPKVDYSIRQRISSTKDYGSNWTDLKNEDISEKVIPALKALGDKMNLNDYLLFRLTESYVNGKFANTDASSRFSLVHFLLANMGYDIRIAVSTSGKPLLLIPFKEHVYARTYMNIDGERYYAFTDDDDNIAGLAGEGIMTCRLPSDSDRGSKFELKLTALNIPEKPKQFKYEYGPLSLTGEVNENLMPILYQYPQMPVEDFAMSQISPDLRDKLVSQVKSQLSSLDGDEKVEALLKFMHNVFEYSTDEDFHGFEKPYFLEETLYYPKNDCEDRAIFYTWFLWNALGREAQLITFPGHESATVVMEKPIEGTSYTYDGKTFYVSDPTYIGSSTGMVMPNYRGLSPEIDYTYRR